MYVYRLKLAMCLELGMSANATHPYVYREYFEFYAKSGKTGVICKLPEIALQLSGKPECHAIMPRTQFDRRYISPLQQAAQIELLIGSRCDSSTFLAP